MVLSCLVDCGVVDYLWVGGLFVMSCVGTGMLLVLYVLLWCVFWCML